MQAQRVTSWGNGPECFKMLTVVKSFEIPSTGCPIGHQSRSIWLGWDILKTLTLKQKVGISKGKQCGGEVASLLSQALRILPVVAILGTARMAHAAIQSALATKTTCPPEEKKQLKRRFQTFIFFMYKSHASGLKTRSKMHPGGGPKSANLTPRYLPQPDMVTSGCARFHSNCFCRCPRHARSCIQPAPSGRVSMCIVTPGIGNGSSMVLSGRCAPFADGACGNGRREWEVRCSLQALARRMHLMGPGMPAAALPPQRPEGWAQAPTTAPANQ